MIPLNPSITDAGRALFPNPYSTGFQVTLTHIAIGTGKYTPAGDETALVNEVARFPIVGGGNPQPNQVQIAANITDTDPNNNSANGQWIGEMGFYAGSTLFAVWSRPTTALFYKTSDFDIPIAYTIDVSILPAESVTVSVVADAAALQSIIFQHESEEDPHSQYLTQPEGEALITEHEEETDPHTQYVKHTEGDAAYLRKDQNLADLPDKPAARTSLGLKSAALKETHEVYGAVGAVQWFPATVAPTGFVKANGALLDRVAYADLWAYAQASGNLAANDGAWSDGKFSPGDGVTNFRIPDLRGNSVRGYDDGRGIDAGRTIGSLQLDQNKTHAHTASSDSQGSHSHGGATVGVGSHSHGGATGSAGDHTHSYDVPPPADNGDTKGASDGSSWLDLTTYASATTGSSGNHSHTISADGSHAHTINADGSHAHGITVNSDGGTEVRVRSVALLACIKF